MKTVFTNTALLISFSLGSFFAQAAPEISSMQYEGADLRIEGTGFGDFGGQVLSWDDFESHTTGTGISGLQPIAGHTWGMITENNSNKGITIDDEHVISGKNAVKVDWFTGGLVNIRAFGWAGKGPYSQLYISYWRRMEGNYLDGGTMNHKQFYVYGNGSASELPQLILMIPAGGRCWGANGNYDAYTEWNLTSDEANNMTSPRVCWEDTKNKFNRWEVFVKLNTLGQKNGILEMHVDSKQVINNQSYPARNVNGEFKDFRLGHMAEGFSSSAKAWFDDVYVASTRARIEVCDAEVYSNCKLRHLQYAKSWTAGSITVDLRNLNDFKQGDSYIYVIDKNGVVSAQGKLIPEPSAPPS